MEDTRLWEQNKEIVQCVKGSSISNERNDVTIVITSCNRSFLLEKTLESFVRYNTYPISQTIVIDDSGVVDCNEKAVENYRSLLNITTLYNKENIGQLRSIDKAYSYVRTKYIFHCEEDWEFLQPSFIEKSIHVFEEHPEEKIFTIWLRPHHETSLHPIVFDNEKKGYYLMHKTFTYQYQNKEYVWCGVTFNPGLRKTKDMYLFHPFTNQCTFTEKKGKFYPCEGEYTINSIYRDAGYFAYILSDPQGHVKHSGRNHHISVDY